MQSDSVCLFIPTFFFFFLNQKNLPPQILLNSIEIPCPLFFLPTDNMQTLKLVR